MVVRNAANRGPIYRIDAVHGVDTLSLLRRSLLFAEFSRVAYYDQQTVAATGGAHWIPSPCRVLRSGRGAGISSGQPTDVVIACRGTEPNETNDIKADIDAAKVVAETVGHVHRGFKREVDELWPMIEKSLQANKTKKVWFCGHSLGGAMATICAGRCFRFEDSSDAGGLVHLRFAARRHETVHQLLPNPAHPLGEQQ